jgi:hypothetical protein
MKARPETMSCSTVKSTNLKAKNAANRWKYNSCIPKF